MLKSSRYKVGMVYIYIVFLELLLQITDSLCMRFVHVDDIMFFHSGTTDTFIGDNS